MMKKPAVDKEKCQGHMVCVGIAPDIFEIDNNGKSEVKDPEGADETTIQQAIDGCPVDAISWKEE
ncbi:ferredoxin [candidate division MSBL1 archaeon SCGC-AAA382F02]|uniref:Ferredoxin n=1 Tax=candidate division MSBL1 archaeon SCGC-AAA382F02 TaxID=1698282 RepID=A0A133VIJ2_9EURY|nr:ferredoxin [candidate division MSBL1 archaeon SCGC-AAA382F02]